MQEGERERERERQKMKNEMKSRKNQKMVDLTERLTLNATQSVSLQGSRHFVS